MSPWPGALAFVFIFQKRPEHSFFFNSHTHTLISHMESNNREKSDTSLTAPTAVTAAVTPGSLPPRPRGATLGGFRPSAGAAPTSVRSAAERRTMSVDVVSTSMSPFKGAARNGMRANGNAEVDAGKENVMENSNGVGDAGATGRPPQKQKFLGIFGADQEGGNAYNKTPTKTSASDIVITSSEDEDDEDLKLKKEQGGFLGMFGPSKEEIERRRLMKRKEKHKARTLTVQKDLEMHKDKVSALHAYVMELEDEISGYRKQNEGFFQPRVQNIFFLITGILIGAWVQSSRKR